MQTIDSGADPDSKELLANIKRLTKIVLDKLEEGTKEGTLDQAQTRLYSSIVMRSIGLWMEAVNPRPRRGFRRELREAASQLSSLRQRGEGE